MTNTNHQTTVRNEYSSASMGAHLRRTLAHGLAALNSAKRRLKAEWLTQTGVEFLRTAGIDKGDTVIDFGCGTGAYSIPAALLVGDDGVVVSVDSRGRKLRRLLHKAADRGLGNIRSAKHFAEVACLLDGHPCQTVLLYDVLHFMDADTRKWLYRAFHEKLGDNGFLSVFPKHLRGDGPARYFSDMTLDDVSKEIEESGFCLSGKRQADLWHNSGLEQGTVLTFHKVTGDSVAPAESSAGSAGDIVRKRPKNMTGMKTALECIPCFVRQAAEAVEMSIDDAVHKERLLRRLLRDIAEADWAVIPVTIAQRIQRAVREETGQADPYHALKDRMNRIALDLLPALTETVRGRPDPREAVVRLAIAGNLLDAGSKVRLAPEDLSARLNGIWDMPLTGCAEDLFRAAANARRILYLADNAGEIVFDRLLIEALPVEKLTVAVRGYPVINDATMADAETAGIPAVAPVIDNGSDAPGTLLKECSEEFRSHFDAADLVIAKGQGNYETLSNTHKHIFFLLSVKCPLIAADIGAPVGALVVKERIP